MITIEQPLGRLILARLVPPFTAEQFVEASTRRKQHVQRLGSQRISIVDVRPADVMPQEQSELLVRGLLTGADGPPLRNAILLPAGKATFALQLARLVREAAVPSRKAFTDAAELEAWLAPVLTPPEAARVREFLAAR